MQATSRRPACLATCSRRLGRRNRAGAAIALINDLPAMLLAVSRLMFAWAEDGIFPRWIARVHPNTIRRKRPFS